jgi:hypothetical protein
LEMKNYRACTLDCAKTLGLNPRNVKAFYRSGLACLALDRLDDARDSCKRGLLLDSANGSLKTLKKKIDDRQAQLDAKEKIRRDREEREIAEITALRTALITRKITWRTTKGKKSVNELKPSLETPIDSKSPLSVPVLLLYPLTFQSDLVQAFLETHTLVDHLSYVLPSPWDEKGQYVEENIACYMRTAEGGVVKIGKRVPLKKVLDTGKVELVDGVLQMHLVPISEADAWLKKFKETILEEKTTG